LYSLESFNGDSGVLSRLLAQALITSASGLAIAVMAMLAYHFLSGRVRALGHDFEWVGHDIHEFLTTTPELDQMPGEAAEE
ncbi:MAG TPA: MotA/TolQ/ExbB proton channel family protein, partial [Opitutae bacterium]|nr:MotA/TolQ/ExbB proton channel family protein [Opitutae bacterium]